MRSPLLFSISVILFSLPSFGDKVRISRNAPIYPEHQVTSDIKVTYNSIEEYPEAIILKRPKINEFLIFVGNENVDLPYVVHAEAVFCSLLNLKPVTRDINMSEFDIEQLPEKQMVTIIENNNIVFETRRGHRKGVPSSIATKVISALHLYNGTMPPHLEATVVEQNYYFENMYCSKKLVDESKPTPVEFNKEALIN